MDLYVEPQNLTFQASKMEQHSPFQPKESPMLNANVQTALSMRNDFIRFLSPNDTPSSANTAFHNRQSSYDSQHTQFISDENTSRAAVAPMEPSILERTSSHRMKLLAIKYASKTPQAEILARLEILNRRMIERAPLVSVDQVTALEQASDQLTRVRASRIERAKRLGLKIEV